MKLASWICVACCQAAWCQAPNARVDVVGSTGFVQLEANSFRSLSPREQALAYWLSQASIAINPIIYDQSSRFGLRQKRVLELVVAHPEGVDPKAYAKILAFTKLFWANRGNHNETTAQKFLPDFTFDDLQSAGSSPPSKDSPALQKELDDLQSVAVRSELRAADHGQEPARRARHPAGQREQFLLRRYAGRSHEFHRALPAELAPGESQR